MTHNEFISRIVSLSPRIFPMAARMLKNEEDANDAVQEIMIKLWNSRKKLGKHPNLKGFVFLTARNHCLDIIKHKRPGNYSTENLEEDYLSREESLPMEDREISEIIRSVINELPGNQAEVVLLRDIDGLDFDEISAITGISKEHTRVLLSRARKYIGKRLKEIYSYEHGRAK